MRGRTAAGSTRRKIWGGLKTRSKRLKRGMKSVMRTALPAPSRIVVCTIAVLRKYSLSEPTAPSSTTSLKPFSTSPARSRDRTGSESKRGKHHQEMRPLVSIKAALRQLPITARSRALAPGPSNDIWSPQRAFEKHMHAPHHNAWRAALVRPSFRVGPPLGIAPLGPGWLHSTPSREEGQAHAVKSGKCEDAFGEGAGRKPRPHRGKGCQHPQG